MADVDLLPPGVDPSDRPPGVDVPPVIDTPVAEAPVEESLVEEEAAQPEKVVEEPPKKKNLYNDEYDLDADNPLAGSGDEDDGIQVTIGEIKPINNRTHHERQYTSKLDIDTVPTINDQPIYDVDLASMEDRPWRKPGADINDYFNYGFTEETWNTYCERQKKLRTEFTSQAAVNKALFSNIHLANPLGMPSMNVRHTNVSGNDNIGNVKVLTDNGGRFKVHHHGIRNDEPVMRTVIGVPNANTNVATPAMDFSKPPPGMNMPPPNINLGAPSVSEAPGTDGPPGIGPPGAGPPGIDGPPGIEMGGHNAIPTVGSGSGLDMSVPPPGFNPALPPPGMSVRPPPIGLPPMGPPGPFNNMLPPPGYNNGVRYPMNPQGASMGRPRPLIDRSYDSRRESGDVDDERRYRRRSRSRSPRRSDRRRDDDRRDRDRDRSDRKDRDRDRTERSRRHRSRSREDRDKRRDRKEDDSDRRKRRHDDDDDRRERKERRKKDERSPQDDESQDGGSREEENAEKQ